MTSPVYALPLYPVFHDLAGKPLEAGYIYIGVPGANAEASPLQVYWDEDQTIPIAQPIRTIAGYPSRNGSPGALYVAGDYSITVRDRDRVLVYSALEGVNFAEAATAEAQQAAADAEAALVGAVDLVNMVVNVLPIERTATGDGTIDTLVFPGVFTEKERFYDVSIGGVAQTPDDFALSNNGVQTTLTFVEPFPIGAIAVAKVMQNLSLSAPSVLSFADRAAVIGWIAANGTPPVGTVLQWQGVAVRYIGSGTVIADMPGYVPDGRATDEHFGGGAAGIAAALAYGDATAINSISTTGQISVTDGSDLTAGRGVTITKAAGAVAGPVYQFGTPSNATFYDMTLSLAVDAAATNGVNIMALAAADSGIVFDRVTADAGILIDTGTGARNGLASWFTVSDPADIDGLTIKDSTFTRFFWGILQANATTGEIRNVSITGNTFDEHGSTYLLFNAPAVGALHENILITGNNLGSVRSRQPFDSGNPGFPHRGSFAGHVHYTRLIGNHAYGYGGEMFRAEEDAKASVWIANTAKLDGKDGIEIIPNNVAGTVYTPTLFAVADNVLENVGLNSAPALGWGIGLHVYTAVSGLENAECIGESTVHDNISKGWAQALQVHQGSQRNLIHHNILADSEEGIKTWQPSLGMQDNLISDCVETIVAERGGMIGRFHIRSADAVPDPAVVVTTTGPLSAEAWTWETGRHGVSNGSVYYRLIDVGSDIDGRVTVTISDDDGTRHCIETGRLRWDGATMIYEREARVSTSNVILSASAPWGVDTSDLAIHIFNGSGGTVNNIRIQVAFDGLHIWGA